MKRIVYGRLIAISFPFTFYHANAISVTTDNCLSQPLYTLPIKTFAPDFQLKIRSTIAEDVLHISEVIADALINPKFRNKSFKTKIENLRMKAAIDNLLSSRLRAIHAGRSVLQNVDEFDMVDMNEDDLLRFIWSNDRFRQRLELAVKLSNEPHVWGDHNFACTPENPCWLQHKMITALDAVSGDVIGFCEVAMLGAKSTLEEDEEVCGIEEPSPTIVNLVTASNYRRRGIATKLTNSVSKFVKRHWGAEELTLYVDKYNHAAVNMYQKIGFVSMIGVDSKSVPQLYMKKTL